MFTAPFVSLVRWCGGAVVRRCRCWCVGTGLSSSAVVMFGAGVTHTRAVCTPTSPYSCAHAARAALQHAHPPHPVTSGFDATWKQGRRSSPHARCVCVCVCVFAACACAACRCGRGRQRVGGRAGRHGQHAGPRPGCVHASLLIVVVGIVIQFGPTWTTPSNGLMRTTPTRGPHVVCPVCVCVSEYVCV